MCDLLGFRTSDEGVSNRVRLVVENNEGAFRAVERHEGWLDDGHLGKGVDGELHSVGAWFARWLVGYSISRFHEERSVLAFCFLGTKTVEGRPPVLRTEAMI